MRKNAIFVGRDTLDTLPNALNVEQDDVRQAMDAKNPNPNSKFVQANAIPVEPNARPVYLHARCSVRRGIAPGFSALCSAWVAETTHPLPRQAGAGVVVGARVDSQVATRINERFAGP